MEQELDNEGRDDDQVLDDDATIRTLVKLAALLSPIVRQISLSCLAHMESQ